MNIAYITENYESVQKHLSEFFIKGGDNIEVLYYHIRHVIDGKKHPKNILYYNSSLYIKGPVLLLTRLNFVAKWYLKKKRIMPDILHGNMVFLDGFVCRILSEKMKIPYVISVRDTDLNTKYLWQIPWIRKMGYKNLYFAKNIIFLSPSYKIKMMELLPEKMKKNVNDKSVVIQNGIDQYFLDHIFYRNKKPDKINIIFVGKIGKRKNFEMTVEAVKYLKQKYNISITAVGEIEENRYKKIIAKNDFIKYIPKCPKEDVLIHMRNSDIFVMPSHTESFGLVYAEAMSQGLPVIYTRGQGFDGQFAEGEVGYSVSDKDYIELAEKIELVLENYIEISNRCSEFAKIYDWNIVIKKLKKVYLKG